MGKLLKYHEQKIRIYEFESLDTVKVESLKNATVLLWLNGEDWDKTTLRSILEEMVLSRPLNITISGKNVEDSFDILLDVLGRSFEESKDPSRLAISGKLDEKDLIFDSVIAEFLSASVPLTERFTDWQSCEIFWLEMKSLESKS